ncbi:MAG: hypothetical protein JW700_01030 [Candidatus Aenigmarchaeota archaeon]|nr:hypothetical protein [Candidatus Aenigmarchaeota archaeon]
MSYKTAFWILIFMTVVSAALQLLGYDFLQVLIVLLIVDSIGFGAMVELERKKSLKEEKVGEEIKNKIDNLENICKDMVKRVSVNSAMEQLEERLNRHKTENKDSLDRLAEKTLSLERRLNNFGAKLAEHIQPKREEDVADYIYLENEE